LARALSYALKSFFHKFQDFFEELHAILFEKDEMSALPSKADMNRLLPNAR